MPELNKDFNVKYPDYHSIEHLRFIFYQAEKRLEESHKNFDSTTTKSVTLISLAVALLSALIAYFFVHNDFKGVFNPKLFTVLIVSVIDLSIVIYLAKNVKPVKYQPTGSLPNKLLSESPTVPSTKKSEELHLKDIYYSEIVNYDSRIQTNFALNEIRLQRINNAINLLIAMPIVGLLIYIITSFLY